MRRPQGVSRIEVVVICLLVVILVAVLAAIILPALARPPRRPRRSCANNLKQMGLIFAMYTNESRGGKFPKGRPFCCDPVDPLIEPVRDASDPNCSGVAMIPNMYALYPEYLNDPKVMLCPSGALGTDVEKVFSAADEMAQVWNGDSVVETPGVPNKEFYPCEVDRASTSYIYTPWLFDRVDITDAPAPKLTGDVAADVESLWATHPELCEIMRGFLEHLSWGTSGLGLVDPPPEDPARLLDADLIQVLGVGSMPRLRDQLSWRAMPPRQAEATVAAQSTIWVMMDRISADGGGQFNHKPAGANVLYVDGHVEFVKYGGKWPVDAKMALLQSREFYESVLPAE